MAYAQYVADASAEEIAGWYNQQLLEMGYRKYREGFPTIRDTPVFAAAYFSPVQPLVSVEVHAWDWARAPERFFELMVTYRKPFQELGAKTAPTDTQGIEVEYYLKESNTVPSKRKVVEDPVTVRRLVDTVNRMPVRSDWVQFGCLDVGPAADLRFVRSNGDVVTLRETTTCARYHVRVADLPVLEDVHRLLWEAIEEVMGMSPEPVPTINRHAPTPTPAARLGP